MLVPAPPADCGSPVLLIRNSEPNPTGSLRASQSRTSLGTFAGGKAAITGDFVLVDKEVVHLLVDKEVKSVARVLRQQGIDVTALHNHGLMDTPRLFYMHFWARMTP